MQILCVAKNDVVHAAELGDEVPKDPIWFLKPESSYLELPATFTLPDVGQVDFEVELVLKIGDEGASHYAIGIDWTARELQRAAKDAGLPWSHAKGQRGFACVGPWHPVGEKDLNAIVLELLVDGVTRQMGSQSQMRWKVEDILREAKTWIDLAPGDVVFCGTPPGVAGIERGQQVTLYMDGQLESTCDVQ